MKCCPFCAEVIQDAAIKCRFCGEFLDGSMRPPPSPQPDAFPGNPGMSALANKIFSRSASPSTSNQKSSVPWYFRTANIVITCLILGPFAFLALPLVWWHPAQSRTWKIVVTLIVAIASAIMIWGFVWGLGKLKANYDLINQIMAS